MTKATKSRAAAKKIKDKWKSKEWYRILAPPMFDRRDVAETLADDPQKLLGRVVVTTPNEIAPDSSSSNPARPYIKLLLQVHDVKDKSCETRFIGHELTSDYIRRLARRRKTKVDVVFDVTAKDQSVMQLKLTAIADKRIQGSQETALRHAIAASSGEFVGARELSEVVKAILNGDLSKTVTNHCKVIYPLRRIEVSKSEVNSQPGAPASTATPAAAAEGEAPAVTEGQGEMAAQESAAVASGEETMEATGTPEAEQ
ncbi:MAG TPA: 30S ribosomal protein S3ae [Thermoplasmata archaeon]|nr:30S ribosomal protein S3ae [Thermoplasmata archaeon]